MTAALWRYVVSHLLAVVAEWASLIGLLVYTFEESGPTATGIASLVTLAPNVFLASSMVGFAHRVRPATARAVSLLVQAIGYWGAATVVATGLPLPLAVAGVTAAFAGATVLRPSGAALLPAMARTSLELTEVNLRVGYCESSSVLLGPLMATAMLSVGGGGAVLAGSALLAGVAAVAAAVDAFVGRQRPGTRVRSKGAIEGRRVRLAPANPFRDVLDVGRGPGRGALGAAIAQYVVVGAFDILLVVLAGEHLDLGDAGAGVLTSLFGIGAVLSIGVSRLSLRRPRVTPRIVAALITIAVCCLAFALSLTVVAAVIVLPLVGCSRSLVDVLARLLLQRSAPPTDLARVFGALETGSGIGLLLGSLLAQGLIAWSGAEAALVGLGLVYVVVVAALASSLRVADANADVPVVEMSVLRELPVFAPLPDATLEALGRSAVDVPVSGGEAVIRQGEQGDRYFAICAGTFDVTVGGRFVRTLRRGSGFGEVALLADLPRTATVQATGPGRLLAMERDQFLLAVTGFAPSLDAAWGGFDRLTFDEDTELPNLRPAE